MSFVKVTNHKDIPFSTETPRDDYYKYMSMEDLGEHCTTHKHEVVKCRTVGILRSDFGKYKLTTLNNPEVNNNSSIRVSFKYLRDLPPPAVVPYPVQMFGYLQFIEQPGLIPTLIQMAPSKKMSEEEKRIIKREDARKRRARIKADPAKYEEAKNKEKERSRKRRLEKKILSIGDLTPRQQRCQRRHWREKAKTARLNKKLKERALRVFREYTPSTDCDDQDESHSPSIIREETPPIIFPAADSPQPVAGTSTSTLQLALRSSVNTPNSHHFRRLALCQTPNVSSGDEAPSTPQPATSILADAVRSVPRTSASPLPLIPESSVNTLNSRHLRRLISWESPNASSGDQESIFGDRRRVSQESPVSRQKIVGIKKSRHLRESTQHLLKNRLNIINQQEKKINALQKQVQRLMSRQQRPSPVVIKPKVTKQAWIMRKKAVQTFLDEDDNSMISPSVKDTITRKKVKKQKRFMCDSMYNLHKKYNAQAVRSLQVSYASFCRLRPFWVVKAKLTDRDTCMCVFHENFNLLVDRLIALKMLENKDFLETVVCSSDSYACVTRKCTKCDYKVPMFEIFLDEEISYQQWVNKEEDRNIQGHIRKVKRTIKDRIICTKRELVDKCLDVIPKYLLHKYNISNQFHTIKYIINNLKQDEILLRIDFSENFGCKYYNEAQGVHFGASREQVSIHTGVLYYYSTESRSTDTISFCSVSSCLRHDASAIFAHLKKSLIQLTQNSNINVIHIVSDGPSSQYKNKNNFFFFTQYLVRILNVREATWNFTETSHGKGPADGVGAAVKETANNHVRQGNDIPDYKTFVEVIKAKSTVLLYEVTENDIEEADILLKHPKKIKNLPGTKKMHQLTWTHSSPTMINMRELTCIQCGISDHCTHYAIARKQIVATEFNPQQNIDNVPADENPLQELTEPVITTDDNFRSNDVAVLNNNSPASQIDSPEQLAFKTGTWILAKYSGKNDKTVLYVGQIISVLEDNMQEPFYTKFTRKKYHSLTNSLTIFYWKVPADFAFISKENILCDIPEPTPGRRGELIFNYNFAQFNYPIM